MLTRSCSWGALAGLLTACVFHPPPPLPEEIAALEAQKKARASSPPPEDPAIEGGGAAAGEGETDGEGGEAGQAGGEVAFKPGDKAPPGLSAEQIRAYRRSQGDPIEGDFTLEMALAGLSGSGTLWALIKTQRGVIDCELFPDDAPLTVANFVGLARGKRPFRDPRDPNATSWVTGRYYDGSSFHRVIPGFMIQGGDPTGTGTGSPGYVLVDEFSPDKIHDRPGVLSMSNIGQSNTGGAQFFITLNPTPHLDGIHTVFGQCSDAGVAIADDISLVPRDEHNKPEEDETIQRIDFEWRSPGDS